MKLCDFVSEFDLIGKDLEVCSLFDETLNCINVDEVIMLDLDYDVIDDYNDDFDSNKHLVEISNRDYQEMLKRIRR